MLAVGGSRGNNYFASTKCVNSFGVFLSRYNRVEDSQDRLALLYRASTGIIIGGRDVCSVVQDMEQLQLWPLCFPWWW